MPSAPASANGPTQASGSVGHQVDLERDRACACGAPRPGRGRTAASARNGRRRRRGGTARSTARRAGSPRRGSPGRPTRARSNISAWRGDPRREMAWRKSRMAPWTSAAWRSRLTDLGVSSRNSAPGIVRASDLAEFERVDRVLAIGRGRASGTRIDATRPGRGTARRGGCARAGPRHPRRAGARTGRRATRRQSGDSSEHRRGIRRTAGTARAPRAAPCSRISRAMCGNSPRVRRGAAGPSQAGRERISPSTRSGYRRREVQRDRRAHRDPADDGPREPEWSSSAARSSANEAIAIFVRVAERPGLAVPAAVEARCSRKPGGGVNRPNGWSTSPPSPCWKTNGDPVARRRGNGIRMPSRAKKWHQLGP